MQLLWNNFIVWLETKFCEDKYRMFKISEAGKFQVIILIVTAILNLFKDVNIQILIQRVIGYFQY
jgi:hypothetical protein